ncbi:MAG: hypothetical protein JRF50_18920 [Deltaproteobacteria bacterium]|nr:hypothetical protein [Deltaproteobacteria bacterium]
MNDCFDFCFGLAKSVMITDMLGSMDGIARALIGPQLEERLGRPLTDWDWWCYQDELAIRAWCKDWDRYLNRQRQQAIDYQIIRNFVWEEEA